MSKIIGNTTATPVPRSDWNQTDKKRPDFIRNKPELGAISEKDIIDKSDLTTDIQSSLEEIDTKANVITLSTEEYTALEEAEATNANTLYMITDAEEENYAKYQPLTQNEYDDLESKDSDTLYFITDEDKVYLGDKFYGTSDYNNLKNTLVYYKQETFEYGGEFNIAENISIEVPMDDTTTMKLYAVTFPEEVDEDDSTSSLLKQVLDNPESYGIDTETSEGYTYFYPDLTIISQENESVSSSDVQFYQDSDGIKQIAFSSDANESLYYLPEVVATSMGLIEGYYYVQAVNSEVESTFILSPNSTASLYFQEVYEETKPLSAEFLSEDVVTRDNYYNDFKIISETERGDFVGKRVVYTSSIDGSIVSSYSLLNEDFTSNTISGLPNNSKIFCENSTINNVQDSAIFGVNHTITTNPVGGMEGTASCLFVTGRDHEISNYQHYCLNVEGANHDIKNGANSHVEGCSNTVTSWVVSTHIEGQDNQVDYMTSGHIEGSNNIDTSSGNCVHIEGYSNTNDGTFAHVEGYNNTNIGSYVHVEGYENTNNYPYTHIEGKNNISTADYQHIQGKYNKYDNENASDYIHIVGNGINDTNRSNAHTIDKDGIAWYAGTIYCGGTGQDDVDNIKEVALKDDIALLKDEFVDEFALKDDVKFAKLPDSPYTLIDDEFIANNGGSVTEARKIIYASSLFTLGNGTYIVNTDNVKVNITGSGNSGYDTSKGSLILVDAENSQFSLTTSEGNSYFYDVNDGTGTIEGDYYTTFTDVQAEIEAALPPISSISKASTLVDSLDTGAYIITRSAGSTLRINIGGTTTSYSGLKAGTVVIKDGSNNLTILGTKHLIFLYDSTNAYYSEPMDLQTITTRLTDIEARLTALGG